MKNQISDLFYFKLGYDIGNYLAVNMISKHRILIPVSPDHDFQKLSFGLLTSAVQDKIRETTLPLMYYSTFEVKYTF